MTPSAIVAKPSHNAHLIKIIESWMDSIDLPASGRPAFEPILNKIENGQIAFEFYRPAADAEIEMWEANHSHMLPQSLKKLLKITNGIKIDNTQWIHPLRSIGPAIRFYSSSRIFHQPVSWYEFGNPADIPANIDLLAISVDSHCTSPVFIFGESDFNLPPRVIAKGFTDWFLQAIESGFDIQSLNDHDKHLGDPIQAHYSLKTPPKLSPRHCSICSRVGEKLMNGLTERQIMKEFDLSRDDLETIIDAFQYRREKMARFRQAD
jgi:hypothetical protein